MKEEVLYYIYSYYLKGERLIDISGREVVVVDPGRRNENGGPDFFNARIKVDGTLWAGNVELHIRSSDWYRHRHHLDENFDNIILHVVYEHDQEVSRGSGEVIPCVELSNHPVHFNYDRYLEFSGSRSWIPCERMIGQVDGRYLDAWLSRLMVSRMERRTKVLRERYMECIGSWDDMARLSLFEGFGIRSNKDPFLEMARKLSNPVIAEERISLPRLEALLFGVGGMLEQPCEDEYYKMLRSIFEIQRQRYELNPISFRSWKFRRQRPSGFPCVRIAQLAALLNRYPAIFTEICDPSFINNLVNLSVSASAYWDNHHVFGRRTVRSFRKNTGLDFIDKLKINSLLPLVFVRGKQEGDERVADNILAMFGATGPEDNAVIRKFRSLGLAAPSAFHTQALLEMKESFCDRRRCLDCRIGFSLMKK